MFTYMYLRRFFAAWRKTTMNEKHPKNTVFTACYNASIPLFTYNHTSNSTAIHLTLRIQSSQEKGSKFNMSNEHRDINKLIGGISVVVDAGPQIGW